MKIPRAYLEWAHGPAAEEGHEPARSLLALPGQRSVALPGESALRDELRAVAELWVGPGTDIPVGMKRTARSILRALDPMRLDQP